MGYDPEIVGSRMNPDLTPEMEREVAFFKKWGYLVVEAAITPDQIEDLRAALDRTFALHEASITHQLLEEDDRFAFLLDNPPVLTRMKAILGNCIQLHSATSRVTKSGEPDQNWHRDIPWPKDPEPPPYGNEPGQINCGYYLDELTMENGPIVILPTSHRAPFKPPECHALFPDEKYIMAKPGQAIMFDGWIFHRGAANKSDQNRRVCLMCYQNAWMKSREPFDGPKVTAMRENGTAEQKLLLGKIDRW
jgi:ectoine hydroxylase-related dioxygenase (phytanoyl-CoA dioxygenase family)